MAASIDDNILEDCGKLYDSYLTRMNHMGDKTWMIRQLFEDTKDSNFCFLGSYLTYPEMGIRSMISVTTYSGEELKDHYGNTTDADLFKNVKAKLSRDLRSKINTNCQYICFVIGGIIKKENVSHHIGFIYQKDENLLRILDPGRQSWGPQTAIEVKNVCLQAFETIGLNPKVIETYSTQRGLCGSCMWKTRVNPQDITRGTTYEEWTRYNKPLESTNREAFCQSWSILLILADIQKIKEGSLDFRNPKMDYWNDELIDLEICIRKFILWIIKRNIPTGIFTQECLDKMERCFQMYNPLITVPDDDDIICSHKLSLHPFGERVRRASAASSVRARASVAPPVIPSSAARSRSRTSRPSARPSVSSAAARSRSRRPRSESPQR